MKCSIQNRNNKNEIIGKILLCLVSLTFALSIIVSGCSKSKGTSEVTFDQLFSDPGKYNNKEITIEGYYFQGFEVNVICERLEYSGYAPGHLVPKGRMVGISGGLPKEVYDALNLQQMMGPLERYGKVKLTGRFEVGGTYPVGAPDKQITPTTVVLLPWSPVLPTGGSGRSFFGAVTAVDAGTNQITVFDVVGKKEYQLKVDEFTKITLYGQPARLKNISTGSSVDVAFDESTMVATKITVGEAPQGTVK